MFRTYNFKHYIEELKNELALVTEQADEPQQTAVAEASRLLSGIKNSRNIVEIWSVINLARAQRAYYLPKEKLMGLIVAEKIRSKDIFKEPQRGAWVNELEKIEDSLESQRLIDENIADQARERLFRYFQHVGKKWNSINAQQNSRTILLTQLTIVGIAVIAAMLSVLGSSDAYTGALFGSVGGLLSSINSVRDMPIQFRDRRLTIVSFIVRPVVGAIVAIVLLQFLVSGISPIQIGNSNTVQSTNSTAWIAAVSFTAGLSERLILGKLQLQQ